MGVLVVDRVAIESKKDCRRKKERDGVETKKIGGGKDGQCMQQQVVAQMKLA